MQLSCPAESLSFSFGLLEMSASMSKSTQAHGIASLSLRMDQETEFVQKQGIVTILGSESERTRASVSSLRRTLSADMSSKKWLSQNGFSPMKKIASSEQLSHSRIVVGSFSSSEEEDDCEDRKEMEAEGKAERGQFDIWNSIQQDKKKEQEKAGQFDIWSSIISQKNNDDAIKSLPNYVHPLVKRSQSSLSEKSLEICTESLGSETGSDVLSSYPPSETGDAEEDKEEEQQQEPEPERAAVLPFEAEEYLPKYNYADADVAAAAAATKKSPLRSFPPPLPSLSRQDGPSLHMRSHRDNGRLVLQAVSVPSQNNFRAQRQDGRLVLTLANLPNHEEFKEDATEEQEEHHMEGVFEDDQKEEYEEFEDEESETEEEEVGEVEIDGRDNRENIETVTEQAPILSSGITGVCRLAMMMNKPVGLVNKNPKCSEKFNEVVKFEEAKVVEPTPVAKSLPPRPRAARFIPSAPAAAAASLNDYEYFWRTKPTPAASPVAKPLTYQQNNSPQNNSSKLVFSKDINQIPNEQQRLVVLRGKNGDYLVHKLKSCKESRRSFLFWEPYCIATS